MPNVGDELHHFGWNACSSALCPWAAAPARRAPLPARARPALVAHPRDRRQGRPAPAEDRQGDRGRGDREQDRLQPAAHRSTAGPTGSTSRALGDPDGDGPGGIFLLDHENFSVKGAWESDRGPQELAYDFWWHLNHGTVITSEWGTPNMVEDGLNRRAAARQQVRPPAARLGPRQAHARPGDRPRRRAPDGARAAPGARPAQDLRLRRRGDVDRRPVGVGVPVGARRRRHVSAEKVITIPAEPAEADQLPPIAQAVRRRAAADHRHRPLGRRHGRSTSPAGAPASSSAST